jgi:hypothetical protein
MAKKSAAAMAAQNSAENQQGNGAEEVALLSVTFKRKWCSAQKTYMPGDIAGLPDAIAKSLEQEGLVTLDIEGSDTEPQE